MAQKSPSIPGKSTTIANLKAALMNQNNPKELKPEPEHICQNYIDSALGSSNNSILDNSSKVSDSSCRSMDSIVKKILMKKEKLERDTSILYDHFKPQPFFTHFIQNNEDLEERESMMYLLKHAQYQSYSSGSVIYKEGELSDGSIYVLLKGEVYLLRKNSDAIVVSNARYDENASLEQAEKNKKELLKRGNTIGNLTNMISTPKNDSEKNPLKGLVGKRASSQKQIARSNSKSLIDENFLLNSNMKNPEETTQVNPFKEFGTITEKLLQDGYFGQKALENEKRRHETAVAYQDSEFMVFKKEDFAHIYETFSKKKQQIIEFILEYFPKIDLIHSHQILNNLYYTLQEEKAVHNECIINEGETSDRIFILYEGRCELIKTFIIEEPDHVAQSLGHFSQHYRIKQKNKEEITICTIESGTFFGEEILYNKEGKVDFTVRVLSANATIFSISKTKFLYRFPREVQNELKRIYTKKREQNISKLKFLVEKKGIKCSDSELVGTKPPVLNHSNSPRVIIQNADNTIPSGIKLYTEGETKKPEESNINQEETVSQNKSSLRGRRNIKIDCSSFLSVNDLIEKVHDKSTGRSRDISMTKEDPNHISYISSLNEFSSNQNFLSPPPSLRDLDKNDHNNSHSNLPSPLSGSMNCSISPVAKDDSNVQSKLSLRLDTNPFLRKYERYTEVMRKKFSFVDDIVRNKKDRANSINNYRVDFTEFDYETHVKKTRLQRVERLIKSKIWYNPTQLASKNGEYRPISSGLLKKIKKIAMQEDSFPDKSSYIEPSPIGDKFSKTFNDFTYLQHAHWSNPFLRPRTTPKKKIGSEIQPSWPPSPIHSRQNSNTSIPSIKVEGNCSKDSNPCSTVRSSQFDFSQVKRSNKSRPSTSLNKSTPRIVGGFVKSPIHFNKKKILCPGPEQLARVAK